MNSTQKTARLAGFYTLLVAIFVYEMSVAI